MHRFCSPLLVCLACCLVLTGCAQDLTADELAFRLLNLYPQLPPCSQFVKDGEAYTAGYLSPEDFALLYTGESTRLSEWDKIEDFRLVLSDSTTFFELHVICAKTASDTDEIAKLLKRRADLLALHNKGEEDLPAREPLIFVSGRYAILVATDDNEAAARLLERLF